MVEYTLPKVVGEVKVEMKVDVPSYVKFVPEEVKFFINGTTERKFKGVRGEDDGGDVIKIEVKKKGQRWDRATLFMIKLNDSE